ncbi:hypothetical protein SAMN04488128_1011766 [Chitinophaga eiseniae]|uniref:Uncharacterized protein n=1 Tax=Chitinophaga eiseniae TaxID=634771 RepID=A0A1T4NUP8_9BACT|nr:hypothetical protein SAMN04488128_1011766 [Chitinophaga eiseniae]
MLGFELIFHKKRYKLKLSMFAISLSSHNYFRHKIFVPDIYS